MNEDKLFYSLLGLWVGLALLGLIQKILLKSKTIYGKLRAKNNSVELPGNIGWLLMEMPTVVIPIICFTVGRPTTVSWVFFIFWNLHYVNRTLIYPFRIKKSLLPLNIVLQGFIFTIIGTYLNMRWISYLGPEYSIDWLTDKRFILGSFLFIVGLIINQVSDHILISLRKNRTKEYYIPQGALFNLVSCPNYLGEIIMWGGWAIMTWCLPALGYFICTALFLAPRAGDYHNWYKEQFSEYPSKRKALIPFIW